VQSLSLDFFQSTLNAFKKVHFHKTVVKIRVWYIGHYTVSGLESCET